VNTKANSSDLLNSEISKEEVEKAVAHAKLNKAAGTDMIPAEVLKNSESILYLTQLYNICFRSGLIPQAWKQNIIHPISKGVTTSHRDPLSYRGLQLLTAVKNNCTPVLLMPKKHSIK
jgi:hypothetical protein